VCGERGYSEIYTKKYVFIETPFKGTDWIETERNHLYTKACVGDALRRGEIPYASHLFFTQRGILDDGILEERMKGIMAGKSIEKAITLASKYVDGIYVCTTVYTDLGISEGMKIGIKEASEIGRDVVNRQLGVNWEEKFNEFLESKDWLNLGLF
jgi:hypothetical protein